MTDDVDPPASPEELARLEALIEGWLADQLDRNPVMAAVERDPEVRRWYVRFTGEQKGTFSIWLTLDQRTLRYETFLMPAPQENHGQLYEHLLRRNLKLYGAAFAIGAEDGIFLVGALDVHHVDEDELDRIVGTLHAYTEQFFRPAMRIGYASTFRG